MTVAVTPNSITIPRFANQARDLNSLPSECKVGHRSPSGNLRPGASCPLAEVVRFGSKRCCTSFTERSLVKNQELTPNSTPNSKL
jgi:hypothetical protein